MSFHSVSEFFYMGGYAAYVWTAYGICFLTLGINTIRSKNKKKYVINMLKEKYESRS